MELLVRRVQLQETVKWVVHMRVAINDGEIFCVVYAEA
jgi:hypothetical protein